MSLPLALLVPLDTLPGWPSVYEPGALDWLMVLLVWPAVAAGLILIIGMAPKWRRHDPDATETASTSTQVETRPR